MAFADETPSGNKMVAVGVVLFIHAFFGWLFISGLAVKAFKVITGPIEIVDVKEKPPEEAPPPPPEKLEEIPPYVPPPEVNVDLPPPPASAPIVVQQTVPQPEPKRVVETPPPPPPPPPQKEIVKVQINAAVFGKQINKVLQDRGVPPSVIRIMESDRVNKTSSLCRVYVGASGKVEEAKCVPEKYQKVAEETESALKRLKFPPATEDGNPVGSWVDLPRIAYVLPAE